MTLCVALLSGLLAASSVPENWKGTIQNHPIHLRLIQSGGKLLGSYRYDKIGRSIPLTGAIDDKGHVTLQETDAKKGVTGAFDGILTALEFHGTWKGPTSKKPLSFELLHDDRPNAQHQLGRAPGEEAARGDAPRPRWRRLEGQLLL